MRHSASARKIGRELDKMLAQVATATRRQLSWDATELATIALLMDGYTRRDQLQAIYEQTGDPKAKMKVATELRLTEAQLARGLKAIQQGLAKLTPKAAPTTRAGRRAQHAANVRWGNFQGATDAN